MSTRLARTAALSVCLGVVLQLSCSYYSTSDVSDDAVDEFATTSINPTPGRVLVCHVPGRTILSVSSTALADHLSHGDYFSTLLVGRQQNQPADGWHFGTLTEALTAARDGRLARGELVSAACRITIIAPAERYEGTTGPATPVLEHFPLIVDVPDITLHGGFEMLIDRTGLPTGSGVFDDEDGSWLSPIEPLPIVDGAPTPIIAANAHPGGSAGNGLTVEGFVFQSGHDPAIDTGGQAVLSVRASDVTIQKNRFDGGFTATLAFMAGSAVVTQNYLAGNVRDCDICLTGPGSFVANRNRLLVGGLVGIVVVPAVVMPVPAGIEPVDFPATAESRAEIWNNEVRDHQRTPMGVGIRVDAIGAGSPATVGAVRASIAGNVLVNNRFGIIVHAGFPTATVLEGGVDVSLHENTFLQICEANLLVSLARHTTALGLATGPYLVRSKFSVSLGGDLDWDTVWYSHPGGFGNTLLVNGQPVANGSRQFYDPVGCPAQGT